jgi:hypothetical protein
MSNSSATSYVPENRDAALEAHASATHRNPALDYLRAFLVILVLAHHSALAYIPYGPQPPKSLLAQPRWWQAFPVIDSHHWAGFGMFVVFNDLFFMSLMFFVSGLFVCSSIRRKGGATFVRDRMIRLGIPFLAAAAIVAPIAYYPTYLMTARSAVGGFWHEWLSLGTWPAGPAWFIWVLLVFDLIAVPIVNRNPKWLQAMGRVSGIARERPLRFYLLLAALSAAAYIPLVIYFGPDYWVVVGPFSFQACRILHYAIYFIAGVAVGGYGIERGLLASDGVLARRWGRWMIAAVIAFIAMLLLMVSLPGLVARGTLSIVLGLIGGSLFAISCGASSFAFLGLFLKVVHKRRAIFDSLSDNEYGMYLIHYMFVSWLQFALLRADLPAIVKMPLVFTGVLALSWMSVAAMRRIPMVRRVT